MRDRVRFGAMGLVVLLVGVWWWWPGITGDPEDVDVHLVIGSDLDGVDQPIERRLREEGFRLTRASMPSDWCDAAEAVRELPAGGIRVVVWAPPAPECDGPALVDDLIEGSGDRRLIVVRLPNDDVDLMTEFDRRGVTVIETTGLLGEPGRAVECLWWEDCPESGVIELWNGDELGPEGVERVARRIVADVL